MQLPAIQYDSYFVIMFDGNLKISTLFKLINTVEVVTENPLRSYYINFYLNVTTLKCSICIYIFIPFL